MQEERKKRDKVKEVEKEFIEQTENSIKDVFKKIIFDHHKKSIKRISECYEKHSKDISQAQECSRQVERSMQIVENNVENYIKNQQEGVQTCIGRCSSNIYKPISECYAECFEVYKQYAKLPYNLLTGNVEIILE